MNTILGGREWSAQGGTRFAGAKLHEHNGEKFVNWNWASSNRSDSKGTKISRILPIYFDKIGLCLNASSKNKKVGMCFNRGMVGCLLFYRTAKVVPRCPCKVPASTLRKCMQQLMATVKQTHLGQPKICHFSPKVFYCFSGYICCLCSIRVTPFLSI